MRLPRPEIRPRLKFQWKDSKDQHHPVVQLRLTECISELELLTSSIQTAPLLVCRLFGPVLRPYLLLWFSYWNLPSDFASPLLSPRLPTSPLSTLLFLLVFTFPPPIFPLLCNLFAVCIHSYCSSFYFFADLFNLLNPFPYSQCDFFSSQFAFKLYKSSLYLSAARRSYIYEYNWTHSSCQKMMPRGGVRTSSHIWRPTFLSLVYSPLKAKSQNRQESEFITTTEVSFLCLPVLWQTNFNNH